MKYTNYQGIILDRIFKTEKDRQEFHELYVQHSRRRSARTRNITREELAMFNDWKKNNLTVSEVSQKYNIKYYLADSIISACAKKFAR